VTYTVTPSDLGNIRLGETDLVNSCLQNVATILNTPYGSVPLYRTFGLKQDFLDKPVPVAKVMMVSRIREAVEKWEPRVTFVSIDFSEDVSQPGELIPAVEVEINEQES